MECSRKYPAVRRVAILALVVAVATAAAAVGLAAQSPTVRLTAMRRSVAAEHSVQYVDLNTWPNHTDRVVADARCERGDVDGDHRLSWGARLGVGHRHQAVRLCPC